jgi:hypothetical protein
VDLSGFAKVTEDMACTGRARLTLGMADGGAHLWSHGAPSDHPWRSPIRSPSKGIEEGAKSLKSLKHKLY